MNRHTLSSNPIFLWALGFITFSLVFIYHTFPLGLSDFWWHINTGRWIFTEGRLPIDDPFLYSSPSPLDARASLILRGYPLSQLFMLGIFNTGGIYALVVMKGLLMTLFYFLLGNQFRRNGLHPLLAFSIAGLLPLLFFRFDELRPQIFSFIGTLLVIQLTEYILACGRQGKSLKWYALVALPLLMLVWANLHRGFIIGIGVVMVYLVAEWISRKRGNTTWSDTAFRHFFIAALVSMIVAFFNPVGVTAVWASFTEVAGPFAQVIDEFFGTIGYFELYGMKHLGYLVVAVAATPFVAMLFKWRKVSMAHLLITALFLIAGIQSFRFSLMMVAVVLSIASLYFSETLNRVFRIFSKLSL